MTNHYHLINKKTGKIEAFINCGSIERVKEILEHKRISNLIDIINHEKMNVLVKIEEIDTVNKLWKHKKYEIILDATDCKDLQGKKYEEYFQWC
jgi:ribosomal 30S subunit maturation factor RimM